MNENSFLIKTDKKDIEPILGKFEIVFKSLSPEQKGFISSLRIISKVKLSDIDNRDTIEHVAKIAKYVCNVNSDNQELINLFGFKRELKDKSIDEWKEYLEKLNDNERKFLIGDLKLKAYIFLARAELFCHKFSTSSTVTYDDYKRNLINTPLSVVVTSFGGKWEEDNDESTKTIGAWIESEDESKYQTIPEKILEKAKPYLKLCEEFVKAKDDNSKRTIAEKAWEMEQTLAEQKSNNNSNDSSELNLFANLDSVGKKFSDNILNDIKYYLFDNSMNEVQYIGFEHYWLWRYVQDKKTLFRCVGTDEFKSAADVSDENKFYYLKNDAAWGRLYYQRMIQKLVEHMNKGDNKNKLSSYSKNPIRDIFKYLSFPAIGGGYSIRFREGESGIGETYKSGEKTYNIITPIFNNDERKCVFAMVKNANTNIVKKMTPANDNDKTFTLDDKPYKCVSGNVHSFSEMINGIIDAKEGEPYGFCVDVLNSYAPTNGAEPRNNFKNYTMTFPNVDVNGLQLGIVATYDEEVVMMGNTCDKVANVVDDKGNVLKYNQIEDNVEYRVELSFEEIVGLFWRIAYENYCERKGISGNDENIAKKVAENRTEVAAKQIKIEHGTIKFSYGSSNMTVNIREDSNCKMEQDVEKSLLCKHLCNTAKKYAESAKEKLDFIIDFIKETAARASVFKNNCDTFYINGDPLLDLYRLVLLYNLR